MLFILANTTKNLVDNKTKHICKSSQTLLENATKNKNSNNHNTKQTQINKHIFVVYCFFKTKSTKNNTNTQYEKDTEYITKTQQHTYEKTIQTKTAHKIYTPDYYKNN